LLGHGVVDDGAGRGIRSIEIVKIAAGEQRSADGAEIIAAYRAMVGVVGLPRRQWRRAFD